LRIYKQIPFFITHMLTLFEPPRDLSKDRTISVRPDSCRRSQHSTAGFELPFSRRTLTATYTGLQPRKGTSSNSYPAADTMPEAVRNWQLQKVFLYNDFYVGVSLMRLL